MFKLLVLSVILAVAAAAPSGLHSYGAWPLVDLTPDYHVSNIVEHIPTAVSHQSRIDFHSKPIIQPIYAQVHAPIYSSPIVHAAPAVHAAPWYGAHGW